MRKLFGKKMSKELGGFVRAWETTVKKSQSAAKKTSTFFPMSAVAHAADVDDDEDAGRCTVKVLPSGDMYDGRLVENLPHGQGKYLWTDGCMYVGEWFRGKTMGKGRFSWPSGATYEGEFKSGYMDGHGTYTGIGGTYKGSWVMNLKHGKGTKHFSNGDYYEGEWRRGVQEGQGRYQWNNGNHYIGQWKSGSMNGNGTLIWIKGNRYDGYWEDGFPKGNGTLRLKDGSFYVGIFCQNMEEREGTYYPSVRESGTLDWDPHELLSSELEECRVCQGEKIFIYPSEKVLDWPGMESSGNKIHPMLMRPSRGNDSRPRRLSVDERLINGTHGRTSDADVNADTGVSDGYRTPGRETEEEMANLESDGLEVYRGRNRHQVRIPEVKRQGETICKGHKNYELMLNLQLGIRHSVGRPAPPSSLDLKSSAFDPKEKVWTKFPSEGSKHTPPHQSCEFKWKDYCPLVFRTLRKLFKVDPADYMISICGNDALRELSSPGKSGSFFYLTNDDKYMIKTMKKSEVKVMIKMLPAYYKHVRAFQNTLVTRFFGLHCVKLTGAAQKKVRFVIMGNLFCAEYPIHRRFDLKGSSHGRITVKPEDEIEATTTLKDLDLSFFFRLEKIWFQEFCRQVDKDCEFLEQVGIMDYSLLVGVHFRHSTSYTREQTTARKSGICTPSENGDVYTADGTPRRLSVDQLQFDADRFSSMTLGLNMAARAEQMIRRGDNELQLIGEPTGELFDVVLFFGIIDILQDYDISKKLEHAYKSIQHDPTSISSVDPKQYSKRFRDFILKVFTDDS